jgi:hypothetical protein
MTIYILYRVYSVCYTFGLVTFGLGRESWNKLSGKEVPGNLEFGETGFPPSKIAHQAIFKASHGVLTIFLL